MPYKRISLIGAGTMGAGLAQVLAAASCDVVLLDIKTEFVENGLRRIGKRLASDVEKGKIATEAKDAILGRIKGSIDLKEASTSDLVIEAIVEDRKVKGDLFQELNRVCSTDTVFATNTSTLSVTDLATLSGRPKRFLGLHFFNPVQVMRLVEIISGLATDETLIAEAKGLVEQIRKVPVVVQDCPGFLVNRILLSYAFESIRCVEEGISPKEIDAQARNAGFPMGPMELTDMVGMDVTIHTNSVLHNAYGEAYALSPFVKKFYEAGRLGLKSGKGIYCDGQVDDEFEAIVKSLGIAPAPIPFSIDRCILRMVNEAVACLQEGVATAEEIDRAMVLGTGFPNQQGVGGPLHWADDLGLDVVVERLNNYKDKLGDRFWPHHLLKTYIAAGYTGREAGRGFFAC